MPTKLFWKNVVSPFLYELSIWLCSVPCSSHTPLLATSIFNKFPWPFTKTYLVILTSILFTSSAQQVLPCWPGHVLSNSRDVHLKMYDPSVNDRNQESWNWSLSLILKTKNLFLAALSSSRSTVVRRSVRRSADVCEKVTFRVSKGS